MIQQGRKRRREWTDSFFSFASRRHFERKRKKKKRKMKGKTTGGGNGKGIRLRSLANFPFCFPSLPLSPHLFTIPTRFQLGGYRRLTGRSTSRPGAARHTKTRATVRYEFLIMHACASARNHAL